MADKWGDYGMPDEKDKKVELVELGPRRIAAVLETLEHAIKRHKRFESVMVISMSVDDEGNRGCEISYSNLNMLERLGILEYAAEVVKAGLEVET